MKDIEFAQAWTRKLEALGVVQAGVRETSPDVPLHPHPRRGRKKIHSSGYDRLKAYRRRKLGIQLKVTDDNEMGL
jgi:hypothetical protein